MQVGASDAPPLQVRHRMILPPTVGELATGESTRPDRVMLSLPLREAVGGRGCVAYLASEGVAV